MQRVFIMASNYSNGVTDQYGLVKEGKYLTMFIPATMKAVVFRVLARQNPGREVYNYGSLPSTTSTTFPTYAGSSGTPTAAGQIPGASYTTSGFQFALSDGYVPNHMWYVPNEYNARIFHVKQEVTPNWIRLDYNIPRGVQQSKFQRDNVITGVSKNFGFARGNSELLHIPELRVGYLYGNDTNAEVNVNVKFTYGEYLVEIPKQPKVIFDILTHQTQSHWVTMPIINYDPTIKIALQKSYGFEGFSLYPKSEETAALQDYANIFAQGVKI